MIEIGNLKEVLSFGPIIAFDQELGLLVTVNGSYFNVWCKTNNDIGEWETYRAFPVSGSNGVHSGLYGTCTLEASAFARAIINELRRDFMEGVSKC